MSRDSEIAIRVENVSKLFRIPHEKHATLKSAALNFFNKRSYTEFQALQDISFEVKKGEFFGIIGRNGSGKSTLLKIMAGIYVPQSGAVKVNGKISPFLELGVGFNPELTGRENIFLGGSILGLSRKEIAEKLDHIVAFSDLREFIDMKLKNYSSGMQVRLAFSLAINAYAEILLMDEVLAVGDANFQLKCVNEFIRYKEEGKTVVMVTHDLSSVSRYCDRVLFLNDGLIKGIGDPKKMIYEYELVSAKYSGGDQEPGGSEAAGTRSEDSWGTQDVIIKDVETLDRAQNQKAVFQSGDGIIIRIHYLNKKNVDKAVFGINISNMEGHLIFGIHSGMINKEMHIQEIGYVDFIVGSLTLSDGRFLITPGISGVENNVQYDYRKDLKPFTVINPDLEHRHYGDVYMKIDIEEHEAPAAE